MQEAVPVGGAMTAVLGLPNETVEKLCEETPGEVSVANYNCPGQIVITGEEAAVDAACEALKAAGAKRTVKLNVSGPFHSRMLAEAGEKLGDVLKDVKLNDFTVQAGGFQRALAAVCGAYDCGRYGCIYRDRAGQDPVRVHEED